MSAAKKGLGRGFDSLIPTDLIDDSFDPNNLYDPIADEDKKVSHEQTLPLTKIVANPDQPRRQFDQTAIEELAASIKEHGLIQPIIVTPKGDAYEIVAGERRYRASTLAGLTEVPVIIRTLSAQNQLELSLVENIQRRDLNAIETAIAYAKLRDQFNLTNEQIAARVHKSSSSIINTMRLLKLPKEAIALVAEGKLREGQVRPLIGQDDTLILEILPKILAEEWSARKVEQYVVNLKRATEANEPKETVDVAPETVAAIDALSNRFNTKVAIRTNTKGAGKIVIDFKNQQEFERIKDLLS
jgi:ParB family transcriptional regulator, chromosome partitioning protein